MCLLSVQLPPNDAYLIFTAAVLHAFNFSLNDRALREAARPRLELCIEWLRVNSFQLAFIMRQ